MINFTSIFRRDVLKRGYLLATVIMAKKKQHKLFLGNIRHFKMKDIRFKFFFNVLHPLSILFFDGV